MICRSDRETVETWARLGELPNDRSTLQWAARLIPKLLAEIDELSGVKPSPSLDNPPRKYWR